jgi:hypothetical protein
VKASIARIEILGAARAHIAKVAIDVRSRS